MATTTAEPQQIRSTIPARLDRLRWSPFHTRMVLGLGTAWILDGLSITVASSVTGVLTQSDTLGLTTTQAAATGSQQRHDREEHPLHDVPGCARVGLGDLLHGERDEAARVRQCCARRHDRDPGSR